MNELPRHNLGDASRIGILNRGEAAMRFIRAVREYNSQHGTDLKTVAFYVDKEEYSPFVKQADDSQALSKLEGFPGRQKSPYLDHDLMLRALHRTSCDAVWVGWGFVSEDAVFTEKIEKSALVFLGPSSRAMSLLGDKITAKELAEKADVPILPWSKKSVNSVEEAAGVAEEIGYPVIVKAANAGGGRGIRFVHSPDDLEQQFNSAREETIRITGNDVVFIEYLVEKGRHLEVQVLADAHGTINTFGVRDCSIQRKNQKIIEETPPPGLSPEFIHGMEESARRLIREAGYTGAGTVEYLYDLKSEKYFFMEVNTRLQVEHPITETLYGIDLVKGQIDVARGEIVDLREARPLGSVLEARLNAEDPDKGFSPAPGEVVLFKAPAGPGIRIDSGIEQNSDIPSEFDSMVAKIIAHGKDRGEAMARLKRALEELKIWIKNGTTNKAFLLQLLDNPSIVSGAVHTGFVEKMAGDQAYVPSSDRVELALMAGAVEMYFKEFNKDFVNFQEQISRIGRPRRLPDSKGYQVNLAALGTSYSFLVKSAGNGIYHLQYDGQELCCGYVRTDHESILTVHGRRYNVLMIPRGDALQCEIEGYPVLLESESSGYVKSQSPAIVLSIHTAPGKEVKKGDILLVLEAMKMEMVVQAPADGVVKELCINEGSQVAAGESLLLMELGEQEEREPVQQSPPVTFSAVSDTTERKRQMCRRNLSALFLGYDTDRDPAETLKEIISFARSDNNHSQELVPYFIELFQFYSRIEKLFTKQEIDSELLARPMTYQELLSHYFRRAEDKEKGLPEEFLSDLEKAVSCYPEAGLSADEHLNYALFNIFKSHGNLAAKQTILKQMFFTLEENEVPGEYHPALSSSIDEIVALCKKTSQSVADAAMHARYEIIDKIKLHRVKEENYRLLDSLVSTISEHDESEQDVEQVIDAGPYIQQKLIRLALAGDPQKEWRALRLLGMRQNRDRRIDEIKLHECDGRHLVHITGTQFSTPFSSIITVAEASDSSTGLPIDRWIEVCGGSDESEVTVLIHTEQYQNLDAHFEAIEKSPPASLKRLSVGIYDGSISYFYRSYHYHDGWEEEALRRGFSPLQFRELRISRLENFNLEILYRDENVILVEATAKKNKKDIRLFAFADVSEVELETNKQDAFHRLVMLETLYMEAVLAMRSAQAKYRYRLQWNRIVIHNRNLLKIRYRELQNYGQRLMHAARDLGLEKLVVYTRRKRWSEALIRELQLEFVVITEDQFSLRSRTPTEKPLEPFNEYVTKVVRARQRNMVYPYEFIDMLTHTGISQEEETPRGEFEEFDIEYTEGSASQKIVSVKDRDPGQNESNIVFGIITNFDSSYPVPLKRVIILADPTKDLGSLAEPECRRVNAALDLADREKLPVEWVPISSGAKIDMNSGTENLDWTAATLRRIIEFTQAGGEINIIVPGTNVGAQSYWNAEATMLMHTRGLLIMTDDASMLLTGKKALDFSGGVSGADNLDIGGVEKIMGPNGQAQVKVANLAAAYTYLFRHYRYTYVPAGETYPPRKYTGDPVDRDISAAPYSDYLGQGFKTIGDIFSSTLNPERKKPFDIRQVMKKIIDEDAGYLERWRSMQDSDTGIVWETQVGGYSIGLIGIESRNLSRIGEVPFDGPESWSGGTLFPMSSKKIARGINAFSGHLPLVILANLSGFDGSPESLRRLQLEYGAEIGRAIVNFKGPISFIVIARYHGGAYVVFSKRLNPMLRAAALEGSYASVIGGAPAAAVIFPKEVMKESYADERIVQAEKDLKLRKISQKDYTDLFSRVYNEKQTELGQKFDRIHSVERAKKVGSIDDIVTPAQLRPYIVSVVDSGMREEVKTDYE